MRTLRFSPNPLLLVAACLAGGTGIAQAASASEWAWTGSGIEMLGRYMANITAAKGMYALNPWYSTGIVQYMTIDDNGSGGVDLSNGANNITVNGNNTLTLTAVPATKTYTGTATWVNSNGSTDALNGYTIHEVWSVKRSPSTGIAIGVVQGTGHQHEHNIASMTANNGSGQGVVVLSTVPTGLIVGDTITIENATTGANNVAQVVTNIVNKTLTLTTPLTASQGGAGGQVHFGLVKTGTLTFTMYPRRAVSLTDSRFVGKILGATNDAKLLGANCQVRMLGNGLEVANDTLNFYDSTVTYDCAWVGTKMIAGAVVTIGTDLYLDRHVLTVTSNGEPVSGVRTMRNLTTPTAPIVTYKYGLFHSRTQLEVVFGADSTNGDWDLTPTAVSGATLTGQYSVGVSVVAGFSYGSGLATINQPTPVLTDPSGRAWWDNLLAGATIEYDPTSPDPGANQMWKLTLTNDTGLVLTGGTLTLLNLDPTTRQVTSTAASMTFTLTPQ